MDPGFCGLLGLGMLGMINPEFRDFNSRHVQFGVPKASEFGARSPRKRANMISFPKMFFASAGIGILN